ncbi:hypothetical protein BZA05DRAFT_74010 [Tricharina praecox]|uniref:uncharacterized protein n=1 Tax=Tricharina praecox TaxID=43433 RepID=UPI00221F3193|nr:uncharacterized protein BZA05DRAFT_74010 [Tricharina praecox]KAI5849699.1 hypothetical protein BZA05DRAFT_74010 [Tricharina praecox]
MGSPTLLVLWSSLSSSTPINTAAKPRFSYPRYEQVRPPLEGARHGLTFGPQSNQSVSSPHRTIPLSFDISQPPPALGLKSKFYLSLRLRAPSRDQSSRLHHHLHSSCAIFWPTPHSPRHTGAPKNMPRSARLRPIIRRTRARAHPVFRLI